MLGQSQDDSYYLLLSLRSISHPIEIEKRRLVIYLKITAFEKKRSKPATKRANNLNFGSFCETRVQKYFCGI